MKTIVKGYCAPLKCQRHRDCLVGDFCNGGLLISGICKTSNKKGYKSCIYDQLNIRTEKKEKEDIPPFGKMRLTTDKTQMSSPDLHVFTLKFHSNFSPKKNWFFPSSDPKIVSKEN